MDYISAVDAVIRALDEERGDLSNVHHGLELVLAGWWLNAASGGRKWDVLGTAVQTVAEDFHDRPPIAYHVVGDDPTEMWRRTVQLVAVIADRLDDAAGEAGVDSARAWWAATSAARLRAAVAVRS